MMNPKGQKLERTDTDFIRYIKLLGLWPIVQQIYRLDHVRGGVGTHIVDAVVGGARHAELEEEGLEGLLAVAGLEVEGRQAQAAVAVGATVALWNRARG